MICIIQYYYKFASEIYSTTLYHKKNKLVFIFTPTYTNPHAQINIHGVINDYL